MMIMIIIMIASPGCCTQSASFPFDSAGRGCVSARQGSPPPGIYSV